MSKFRAWRAIDCGCFLALLCGFAICVHNSVAFAGEGASFYKGKTVRIVVGYPPGGGNDAYARLIAPRLAKRLDASVIVENQPGGGGLTALSALLNVDPPDGLRLMLLNGEAAALTQLIEPEAAGFDLEKLTYLGRVSFETRTLIGLKSTPYANIRGFTHSKAPVIFGGASRIDGESDAASILCYSLGIRCKLILGYRGSAEISLAIQRGEVNAFVTSGSEAKKLVKTKDFVAVAALSKTRGRLLPTVPSIFELVSLSPQQRKWILFRAQIAEFGRTLVMRGGTPPQLVAAMTSAVQEVLEDPALQTQGSKINLPIAYASAADVKRTLDGVLHSLNSKDRSLITQVIMHAY